MVEKYCNGVDLNCGCPQKWAIKVKIINPPQTDSKKKMSFFIKIFQEGIGACLINNPEFVADVVKQTR